MVDRKSFPKQVDGLDDFELARDSIHNIKRISEESIYDLYDVDPEKSYRLSYLRKQFTFKGLDELFNRYMERIDHVHFSLFLILQTVFSITHFILVITINQKTNTLPTVIPDLTLYSITGLLSLITLYVNERYLKTKFYMVKYLSFLIFIIIYATDLFIPIYYSLSSIYKRLRPAYIVHILIAIYCFIGITKDLIIFLLGAFVTITHLLTLAFVTYDGYNDFWKRLGSDIIFMVCLNGLGVYHLWASELIKRRAFLDHRACVESTLKLKFEKEQEEQLMMSIIPEHTIDKVRKDILDKIEVFIKMGNLPLSDPMDIPYVQEYDNVTILYADIVNYTAMTSQLPVIILVDTLNELFSGFDDASEELNVMRIKFLGDCYYSVAGLPPNPAPNHAEACVDLGLRMISIIRAVRERRNLTIDMRIGIHSGRILSGLIGSTKWQFDIWSKDVYLANKMETSGKPGQIHITKQTYDLLTNTSYNIIPSDRGVTNPHLQGYNVQTYFIIPQSESSGLTHSSSDISIINERRKRLSMIGEKDVTEDTVDTSTISNGVTLNGVLKKSSSVSSETPAQPSIFESRRESLRNVKGPIGNITRRASGNPALAKTLSGRRVTPGDIKRRTAFMENNINRYKMLLAETQENIKVAIEEMPLTKYDQWVKVEQINPLLLIFKTWQMEKKYIQLPDKLFRFYLINYVALLVATILIQNLNLSQWKWHLWSYYGTLSLVILILLPLTWLYYFWNEHFTYRTEYQAKPKNVVLKLLYETSRIITTSSIVRTIIYVVSCGLFLYCVLEELTECNGDGVETNVKTVFRILIEKSEPNENCVIPWHLSHTLSLTILMGFFFIRVHLWLKLFFALSVTTFYGISLWNLNYTYLEDNETFNYQMSPKISDMVTLVFLTFALHLLDRQSDYLNRLDFHWTQKLVIEQVEVNTMNKITKKLLQNILPAHVAQLYLDVNRKNNNVLYNEEYENVAVIFASVTDSPIDLVNEKYFLAIVNYIIKDFDNLLRKERKNPIEKIKVTNLTYMAACGLDPGKTDMLVEESSSEHVAVTLTKFAVDLIKALKRINGVSLDCKLRIGISHGRVMGGVVGSKKPLYDIWSDAVNMASRMDSTGVPGKIQVTENTAKILQENEIVCEFRDYMYVKGKENKIPTYFVSLDDNDDLIFKANNTKL